MWDVGRCTGPEGPYSRPPAGGGSPAGRLACGGQGPMEGAALLLWDIVAHFAGKRKALRMENRRKMCVLGERMGGWVFFWAGM